MNSVLFKDRSSSPSTSYNHVSRGFRELVQTVIAAKTNVEEKTAIEAELVQLKIAMSQANIPSVCQDQYALNYFFSYLVYICIYTYIYIIIIFSF